MTDTNTIREIAEVFQRYTLAVSLSFFLASFALLVTYTMGVRLWDAIRRWIKLSHIEALLVAVFVIGFIQYGATKSSFHYDGGIKGTANTYTTNDTIHIEWERDTSQGVLVPESAAVYIDYRPNTATNEEWGLLAQTTVGAWSWEGTLANATNYDFNVWAYYIPPEPVHTNGVWVYRTMKDRGDKYPIPMRSRVEVNGKVIATPAEKRKDD